MKMVWVLLLMMICLLSPAALAEESGRKARVHLRDGIILDGVVLGCASGVLQIATPSQKHSVGLDAISRIEFGEAVGPHVRVEPRILDPGDRRGEVVGPALSRVPRGDGTQVTDLDDARKEPREPRDRVVTEIESIDEDPVPTEGPRTGSLRPDEERRRRLNEFVRWVVRLNMFRQLELSTDYFRDAALIQKVAADWDAKLRATPEKGEANKDIRLALTTLAVAAQQRLRAHTLLASLKKDYPNDETLQKLTIGELEFAVARARLAAVKPRGHEARPVPPRFRGQPD